jgi:drug/metabolite transporter (DMT)-like permease
MARLPTVRASPYLLLTLTIFMWSLNWVIGRAIVGHVTPFALTFARWLVALAVMLPFVWRDIRAHWPTLRRHWKLVVWFSIWGTGLQNALVYLGLQYTTTTNGVMFNSSMPIMIILLGWLIYRDTITRMQVLGVVTSLVGVFVILTRGDASALAQLSLNKGDLLVIGGIAFWATYTVFARLKPPELPGIVMLACCGCVGLVILLPFFVAEMVFFDGRMQLTLPALGAMLYVGIFATFVAYVFWNRAVAEVGSNIAGIFIHLMLVFGSLLAWIFLGERIHTFHMVGIALILTGIALTSRRRAAVPAPGRELRR